MSSLTEPSEAAAGHLPVEGTPPATRPGPVPGGTGTGVHNSPARRAWLRFRRNRLGYVSLVLFVALVVLSLLAEVISNDRPLVVRYQGETYFPILK